MTRTFYTWLLLGIVAVFATAAFVPMAENKRYRSTINVVRDGGSEEAFVIQLPQDRIGPVAAGDGILTGNGLVALPSSQGPVTAELYRLRDIGGNVIGLASRSTYPLPGEGGRSLQATDWVLQIPSRGSLFLTQVNAVDVAVRTDGNGRLRAPIDMPGFWNGQSRLAINAGPAANGDGRVLGGAAEFAGMTGQYDEDWTLESELAAGVRARITLTTRVVAADAS